MAARQKNQVKIEGRPVWAEVSAAALTYNLRAIHDFVNPPDEKRKTPRKVLSIVKGNGYGHGGPQDPGVHLYPQIPGIADRHIDQDQLRDRARHQNARQRGRNGCVRSRFSTQTG